MGGLHDTLKGSSIRCIKYLLRKLFFTQFVQSVKLAAKDLIFTETCAGKFHSHDDGSVRYHHGHCAELNFQVLRELLSTSITWVL